MDIVIASANEGKVREFRKILKGKFEKVYSLTDLGILQQANETGATFAENARIKAEFIKKFTDCAVLADDSGLCVDALNGAPGVYSARYAGEHSSDSDNRIKLIEALKGVSDRRARFVCALCLLLQDGSAVEAEGETCGEITDASFLDKGNRGFGYDRIFFSYDLKTTFGLADETLKNSVSHRKRAFDVLLNQLKA